METFKRPPIICENKTELQPCEVCFVHRCPYLDNPYAIERVGRRNSCPFNTLGVRVIKDEFKLNPLKASKRGEKA